MKHSLLRIYIGESDMMHGKPLYETLLLKARETRLAGATVFKGFMGYGHASIIHTAKILRLSEDLPILIEIADTEDKIDRFIPNVKEMMKQAGSHGLITREQVEIIPYRE
ncbi:MAG: DUF190 domain-containing protein [Ignavibacteriales bacterium]|nr:MAG: DUF190 domain-containing protein [Ignavibacteriales bacterium]